MRKQELYTYGALGALAAWLLWRVSGPLGALNEVAKEKVENLWEEVAPGTAGQRVQEGVSTVEWGTELAGWQEGWYDSFKVNTAEELPAAQAGFLEFQNTVIHFDGAGTKELNVTALQGDPMALFYFGRACCNVSNLGQLVLTGQPFRKEFFQADCFDNGYGFEFRNPNQGQRVVRRLYEEVAVDWIYQFAGHHKEPGQEMRSWLTAAGRHYLIMVDRNPRWV